MKIINSINEKTYSPVLLLLLSVLLALWLKPDMDIPDILYLLLWFLILTISGFSFQKILKWYIKKKLKLFIVILLTTALLLVLWVLTIRINSFILDPVHAWSNKLISFALVTIYLISNYKISTFFSVNKTTVVELNKELSMKELELDFMKNQFNPHYLFNSLNNVAATIMVNRDLALDYTYKLAEMLRYQTDLSEKDQVRITEEKAFIRNFLDVEKLRLGDRCQIEFTSEINEQEINIPPFLLHPLIEFCLRESLGLQGKSSFTVKLSATISLIKMNIRYSEPVKPAQADSNKRGYMLVSARLKQFYPGKHNLVENKRNGVNEIDLFINL